MPFDVSQACQRLHRLYGTGQGFRHGMLDLLFAAGGPVRERAFALEHGDAFCIEASGPAAPSLAPPRVIVFVDLVPPHLSSVALALGAHAAWPSALSSLGGPRTAMGWASCLYSLARSTSSRPWRLLYVQGPAMGTSDALESLIGVHEPEAELIFALPSVARGESLGSFSLAHVELVRSRNVWRFPACERSYALQGEVEQDDVAFSLGQLFAKLEGLEAWTLHDLHIYPAESIRLSAVLRATGPAPSLPQGLRLTEVDTAERLMFPINDAIGAMLSLAESTAAGWGDALRQPLHFRVLPDGASLFAIVPSSTSVLNELPPHLGPMSVFADERILAHDVSAPVVALSIDDTDQLGPVPSGMEAAALWQLPRFDSFEEAEGASRALAHMLAGDS